MCVNPYKGDDRCPESGFCRWAALVTSRQVQAIGVLEVEDFTLPTVVKQFDLSVGDKPTGFVLVSPGLLI